MQNPVNIIQLTIPLKFVPDILEGPDSTFKLQHEGEDLAVLGQTALCYHNIHWPVHLHTQARTMYNCQCENQWESNHHSVNNMCICNDLQVIGRFQICHVCDMEG